MSAQAVTIQHVRYTSTVDGGYSGDITITLSKPPGGGPMFFVESSLLQARLVLTPEQTEALGEALVTASEEALPPKRWSLQSYSTVFRRPVPKKYSRTAADLKRHVHALSAKLERREA